MGALWLFAGAGPVAAGDGDAAVPATATAERGGPERPDRWRARTLDEPIFGSELFVVEAGSPDQPTVLLVHGLGQNGYRDWWPVIQRLEADHHVVALDLPGFGRSSTPAGPLSPDRYARLLGWLTAHMDLEDVNLVAHSMGAAIAVYHASRDQGRIDNVVLADVAGVLHRLAFVRALADRQLQDLGLPPTVAGLVREWLGRGERFIERLLLASDLDTIDLLRQSGAAWNAMLDERPNAEAAIALLETDYARALARFDEPVTLLWGKSDRMAPLRTGYMLDGRLPRSRLHVFEDTGHMPMRSRTDAFMQRLRAALADPPGQAQAEVSASTGERADYACRGDAGERISGDYDRIVIADCPGMELVDVRARSLRIRGGGSVTLRHVAIDAGDGAGLTIAETSVTATDLRVAGDPAVRIDAGRLDLAGASLKAPEAGLRVAGRSSVIVSVSDIDSGVREGYMHGAVRAARSVLDAAPGLRSVGPTGQTVRGPDGRSGSRLRVSLARQAVLHGGGRAQRQ
jgi:pimeloyl-ACP methyl ester carboxylesterase